jgi:hypothetical protein
VYKKNIHPFHFAEMERIRMRSCRNKAGGTLSGEYLFNITIFLFFISGGVGCGVDDYHLKVERGTESIKKLYTEFIVATMGLAAAG